MNAIVNSNQLKSSFYNSIISNSAVISANGLTVSGPSVLGASNSLLGFYGSSGTTRKTTLPTPGSSDATDNFCGSLKSILLNTGFIST